MAKYYYDKEAAEDPISWIEKYCHHYIGELKGQPLILDEHQKEPLRELFGWRVVGKPHYLKHSTFWYEVPRGDGKSTYGTAIGLYIAFGSGIKSSRVYCFASSKEQSKESVFLPAKYMCETINEKHDAGLLLYHSHVKDPESDSTFQLMSADWKGGHSLIGSAFIIDEIHLHMNGKLFGGIDSGAKKRTDCTPLKIILTTAGEVDTFGHTQHEYALAVKNGTIKDESYLVRIFTAGPPSKDDPDYYFRESTHKIANPGWNHINQHEFAQSAERAKNSPIFLNDFLRYNLNIWVGSSASFIPQHEWDKCNKGIVPIEELYGEPCYAGFHFMYVRDVIGLTLFFPSVMVLKRWFWCPRVTLREREIKDPRTIIWREQKYITEVSGNAHDFKGPKETIQELIDTFQIMSFDYRCREVSFIDWLNDFGIPLNAYALTHSQMSAPTTKLEELIVNGEINHEGNPVSDYMMRAVAVVKKDDEIKMSPEKSSDRIPGPLADVLAIAGWMNDEGESSTLSDGISFFSI